MKDPDVKSKEPKRVNIKKAVCLIFAIIFLVLGLVGLALPIIPQIPFLLLGVILLSIASTRFKTFLKETELYKNHLKKYVDKSERLSKIMDD